MSLDRGSPGQSELLAEEGVQLGLGELHHQELEAGVEEAGVPGLVTGHLGLPLAQPGHGVKQVSRRTTETDNIMFQSIRVQVLPVYSVRTEHPCSHLLAHEELGAGAGVGEVARLRARVQRAGGDGELTFYVVSPFIIVSVVIVIVWVSAIITVIVVKTTRANICSSWAVVVSIGDGAFFSLRDFSRKKVVVVVVSVVINLSVSVKSASTVKDRPTLARVIFPIVVVDAVVGFSDIKIIFHTIYFVVVGFSIFYTIYVVVAAFRVIVITFTSVVVQVCCWSRDNDVVSRNVHFSHRFLSTNARFITSILILIPRQ